MSSRVNLTLWQVSVKIDMIVDDKLVATMDQFSPFLKAVSHQELNELLFNLTDSTLRVVDRPLFEQVTAGIYIVI